MAPRHEEKLVRDGSSKENDERRSRFTAMIDKTPAKRAGRIQALGMLGANPCSFSPGSPLDRLGKPCTLDHSRRAVVTIFGRATAGLPRRASRRVRFVLPENRDKRGHFRLEQRRELHVLMVLSGHHGGANAVTPRLREPLWVVQVEHIAEALGVARRDASEVARGQRAANRVDLVAVMWYDPLPVCRPSDAVDDAIAAEDPERVAQMVPFLPLDGAAIREQWA